MTERMKTLNSQIEALRKRQTIWSSVHSRTIAGNNVGEIKADFSLLKITSILLDTVSIPEGEESTKSFMDNASAIRFVEESYKQFKFLTNNRVDKKLWEQT